MFTELMPLLRKRGLLLTISLVEGDTIRATIVPRKASDTENNSLTTPLAITGTPRNPLQKFHHLGSTAPYSRKAIYTTQIHSYSPARVFLTVPRQVSERGNSGK